MNLGLQGGGIYGIAHGGVISALDESGKLSSVTSIAGTSAGSIVGTLAAMRLSGDQIKAIINSTDFSTFKDGNFMAKIEGLSHFGWYEGNVFLSWLRDQIDRNFPPLVPHSENPTFTDLQKAG